jgi:hypothetical protein
MRMSCFAASAYAMIAREQILARHTNPDEVNLGFRYITREFANLWITRFSGERSCECFNLFGKHWVGGHRQTQSVTARVQRGVDLA